VTLVVSIPESFETEVSALVAKYKWPIRIVQVNDKEAKFSAIAGSDIGIAVNGQIVAELAGLQLPTIVVDPEPFLKSYYRSLWNSFSVELNLASNGEIYPYDLILNH
jgi:hypothetical protein